MITLATELYQLQHKIEVISRLIEGDEEKDGILENIDKIILQNENIINQMQKIENQLSLIIQVLASQKHG